jgi:hypothetical protein
LQEEFGWPPTLISQDIVPEGNQAELDGAGDGLARAAPDLGQRALGLVVQPNGASGHIRFLIPITYYYRNTTAGN